MSYDSLEQSRYGSDPLELFKFTAGGVDYLYTSADAVVVVGGANYMPTTVIRARIDQTQEQDSGSIEITVDRLNPIAKLFMAYSPISPVAVVVTRLHRSDPSAITLFSGAVSAASFQGGACVLTCVSGAAMLGRLMPGFYYQRQCNNALYDAKCAVNRLTYKDAGVLTYATGATIKAAIFATHADGWYENGYVETAAGERRHIVTHVGDTLTLLAPVIGLAIGASVDAYPGCDRTEATCASKFSNLDNHEGFPRIPLRNVFQRGVG